MAKYVEPKDYMLGRKAYKAYFDGVGIEFTDLSHDYQMRWVNVARAVTGEINRLKPKKAESLSQGPKTFTVIPRGMTDEELLEVAPKTKGGRVAYNQIRKGMHGRIKRAVIKVSKQRYYKRKRHRDGNQST